MGTHDFNQNLQCSQAETTIAALKEAKQISSNLHLDLKAIALLRQRVERDAGELLSEMALVGGRLEQLRTLLPTSDFSKLLKRSALYGDTASCIAVYRAMSGGASASELLSQIFNMRNQPSAPTSTTAERSV